MPLTFNSIQPVRFGDFTATPKLNQSTRLRIQNLKANTLSDDVIDQLSAPFGADSERVAEFIKNNMSMLDVQRLQAYLAGGESMLDSVDEAIKGGMHDAIKGAGK